VNYNEVRVTIHSVVSFAIILIPFAVVQMQAEDDFDEQLPSEDYNAKRPSRSSTSSSFQEADSRGAKRDFEETESVDSDSAPPFSSRSDTRAAKRARGNESNSRGDTGSEEAASPEL